MQGSAEKGTTREDYQILRAAALKNIDTGMGTSSGSRWCARHFTQLYRQ